MDKNKHSVKVPDVESEDEADIEGVGRAYAQLKSKDPSELKSVEFEVFLDEEEKTKKQPTEHFASNFFYDDKLLNSLGIGNLDHESGCSGKQDDASSGEEDLEPFEKLARTMEDITGDEGVLKKVIQPGVGGELCAGTSVKYHYSCFLEYGDEPIDSTHLRNSMAKTKLGKGDVLPGLGLALSSMKLKETAHFLVKPSYAFGKLGCPPRIPGNVTLLYEVRLEIAVDCAAADDTDTWDWEKHNVATFQERLDAARAYHRKGNSYYTSDNLGRARRCYQRGVWLMEQSPIKDEKQELISCTLQTKLFSNMAKIHIDQCEPTKACTQCRLALELPYEMPTPLKAKVYFRYGVAKSLLNSFKDARKYFILTQNLKPNCPAVAKYLQELTISERKYEAQEKFMYKKMFTYDENERTGFINCTNNTSLATDKYTTIDNGVIITEFDSMKTVATDSTILEKAAEHALEKVDKFQVHSHETKTNVNNDSELTKRPGNLKLEFVEIVLGELDRLLNTAGRVKEVLFPSNLSIDEIAFITSTAVDYGCRLEFVHRGNVRYPKVVKNNVE